MKIIFSGRSAALAATISLASVLAAPRAEANVKLSPLLSDGMVLQRNALVRVWGTADPGEAVTIKMLGQTASATAGADGNWSVMLKSMKAGGPYEMTISGKNAVTLKNVLVGEVWVCSGQSNMEWPLAAAATGAQDIAAANDPMLRSFTVAKRIAATPTTDLAGAWEPADPQHAGRFSAVGYYFGQALRKSLGVPIGLIHTSWGGTPIEAWTRKDVLLQAGVAPGAFDRLQAEPKVDPAVKARYDRSVAAWKAAGSPVGPFSDPGVAATARGWEAIDTDASGWKTINVPGNWEQSGVPELEFLDGAVWFRAEVDVPADRAGKSTVLSLGAIDDADTTYFNGVKVGGIGAETASSWMAPRRYDIDGKLVRAGRNVIAVRVWDNQGGGGMTGPADAMRLGNLPLQGLTWRYRVENGRASDPGSLPTAYDQNSPTTLYNAMIVPVLPYTIQGAIWYQGESNAGNPAAYRKLLPAMIQNWRDAWGIKDFPFLIVQLAPYMKIQPQPTESNWAALREAQTYATTVLPKVGVAVITDVGEENDIHPRKKQPVGERLAVAARKIAYGEKVVGSGPTFKSMAVEGSRAVLRFDNVGKGLEARGGNLTGFAIAGADGKFVWADAAIEGNTVVVSAPSVAKPTTVRFGWADYPVVNLWNKDGLPAVPFRTDAPK